MCVMINISIVESIECIKSTMGGGALNVTVTQVPPGVGKSKIFYIFVEINNSVISLCCMEK